MVRLVREHPAEGFLSEKGLIERRTFVRRALLGCVGCRWLRAAEQGGQAELYGLELARCTGIGSGTVKRVLTELADIGAMAREPEDIDPAVVGRPARVYFRPVNSELGVEFQARLTIPPECPLVNEA